MDFRLKILTPLKEIFNDRINSLIVPADTGELGILANHLPIISVLKKGNIKIKGKEINKNFLIEEAGLLKFDDNEAIILVNKIKDL